MLSCKITKLTQLLNEGKWGKQYIDNIIIEHVHPRNEWHLAGPHQHYTEPNLTNRPNNVRTLVTINGSGTMLLVAEIDCKPTQLLAKGDSNVN